MKSSRRLKRGGWLVALALVLIGFDFLSKFYVHQNIPLIGRAAPYFPYGGIPVFHDIFGVNFSIVHAMNKGAAWGMLASLQMFLLYLRIAVIIGLLVHLVFFNKDKYRDLPFVLIISGAIGNVVDFFIYGQVVDMFYFTFGSYSYPIFNIADSAIFCGVVLLFLKPVLMKFTHK